MLATRLSSAFIAFSLLACAAAARSPVAPEAVSLETPAPAPTAEAPVANDGPAQRDEFGVPPPDAEQTPSGIKTKLLVRGTGTEHPLPSDNVRVRLRGYTIDGKPLDPNAKDAEPRVFLVEDLDDIAQGLQLMVAAETRRIWIPAGRIADMESPPAGVPEGPPQRSPRDGLVYDVELLEILRPPKAPPDVAAPPAAARTTPSGLVYLFLVKGRGTRQPTANDRVKVHYSGWTTGGKLFDSSVTRGAPSTFPLHAVITGWAEAVMLMAEGDKLRVWIPPALAYGAKPAVLGVPSGTLVYEIELLKIE